MSLKKKFLPYKNKKMNGIYVTKKAYKKICSIIKKNKCLGIQIYLKKFGCAGFSHVIEPMYKLIKQNINFTYKKIIISIPKKKSKILDSLTIDLAYTEFKKSFKFYHKKKKNTCGCGESFQF